MRASTVSFLHQDGKFEDLARVDWNDEQESFMRAYTDKIARGSVGAYPTLQVPLLSKTSLDRPSPYHQQGPEPPPARNHSYAHLHPSSPDILTLTTLLTALKRTAQHRLPGTVVRIGVSIPTTSTLSASVLEAALDSAGLRDLHSADTLIVSAAAAIGNGESRGGTRRKKKEEKGRLVLEYQPLALTASFFFPSSSPSSSTVPITSRGKERGEEGREQVPVWRFSDSNAGSRVHDQLVGLSLEGSYRDHLNDVVARILSGYLHHPRPDHKDGGGSGGVDVAEYLEMVHVVSSGAAGDEFRGLVRRVLDSLLGKERGEVGSVRLMYEGEFAAARGAARAAALAATAAAAAAAAVDEMEFRNERLDWGATRKERTEVEDKERVDVDDERGWEL